MVRGDKKILGLAKPMCNATKERLCEKSNFPSFKRIYNPSMTNGLKAGPAFRGQGLFNRIRVIGYDDDA